MRPMPVWYHEIYTLHTSAASDVYKRQSQDSAQRLGEALLPDRVWCGQVVHSLGTGFHQQVVDGVYLVVEGYPRHPLLPICLLYTSPSPRDS